VAIGVQLDNRAMKTYSLPNPTAQGLNKTGQD